MTPEESLRLVIKWARVGFGGRDMGPTASDDDPLQQYRDFDNKRGALQFAQAVRQIEALIRGKENV